MCDKESVCVFVCVRVQVAKETLDEALAQQVRHVLCVMCYMGYGS